ncbi:hypothetical protein QWZ03_00495 [Chitinimonas viridis]|uniref:Uncharacterized protein n=1 Tax=Chitinimonas viridis TaxID=664880 RepID=A0ABT8AZ49_9NEIS|nr:hypothetical protein [Chitinimonas viridis]MDN3575252.1 hypothetical protein [Chitinimonas viridis]
MSNFNYSLDDVCTKMLGNADMTIDLSCFPRVQLYFTVSGKVDARYWRVRFTLRTVLYFQAYSEEANQPGDLFLVLGVNVEQKPVQPDEMELRAQLASDDELVWRLTLHGDITLQIVSRELEWQVSELSPQEYEARYN